MSFKARTKSITSESALHTGVGRTRADACGEVVFVRGKNLRLVGREFHKRAEELRNGSIGKN